MMSVHCRNGLLPVRSQNVPLMDMADGLYAVCKDMWVQQIKQPISELTNYDTTNGRLVLVTHYLVQR